MSERKAEPNFLEQCLLDALTEIAPNGTIWVRNEALKRWAMDHIPQGKPVNIIVVAGTFTRCGKCENCVKLEQEKKIAMPYPPFSHADTQAVRTWNKRLYQLPCQTWLPQPR